MKKVRIAVPPEDKQGMLRNGAGPRYPDYYYTRQDRKKKLSVFSGFARLYRKMTEIPDERDPMSEPLKAQQLQQLYLCSLLLGRTK